MNRPNLRPRFKKNYLGHTETVLHLPLTDSSLWFMEVNDRICV